MKASTKTAMELGFQLVQTWKTAHLTVTRVRFWTKSPHLWLFSPIITIIISWSCPLLLHSDSTVLRIPRRLRWIAFSLLIRGAFWMVARKLISRSSWRWKNTTFSVQRTPAISLLTNNRPHFIGTVLISGIKWIGSRKNSKMIKKNKKESCNQEYGWERKKGWCQGFCVSLLSFPLL